MTPAGRILVVDDEAMLRMNLRAFLEDLGIEVKEAGSGLEAFDACRSFAPDLILLDVSMPGMDGFETCRRLKADPGTAEIPVLFLTALQSTSDKVKAFQVGAVDYVTKPFHFEEIGARIRAHLELQGSRRKLKEQHEALLRLEQLRDSLIHMIAHDMRSPLTAILGTLELFEEESIGQAPHLKEFLERAQTVSRRLIAMISEMLDVSRMESGEMPLHLTIFDLVSVTREAIRTLAPLVGHTKMRLNAPPSVEVEGDPELLRRLMENLLANALKYSPTDSPVEISIIPLENRVKVAIADRGPGVPPDQRERIFEKFGQASASDSRRGAGIGLAFCRLVAESHHGTIGVDSEPGQGSSFWFTLPTPAS